ncbi:13736_t:CDS:1 [Acaulospora colombiana]|uniref:13736_t:CDS:1 n=1 Tax=Acaulospora colombiana TaxID=27376 RepID=A0ACA9K5H3_9GLOM|nr:13736_t:CDS:1 [Acaulospora colombiana]
MYNKPRVKSLISIFLILSILLAEFPFFAHALSSIESTEDVPSTSPPSPITTPESLKSPIITSAVTEIITTEIIETLPPSSDPDSDLTPRSISLSSMPSPTTTSTVTKIVTILPSSIQFSGTETIEAFSFPSGPGYAPTSISLSSMPLSAIRVTRKTTPTESHYAVHFTPTNVPLSRNAFSSNSFPIGNYFSSHVIIICWLVITISWVSI